MDAEGDETKGQRWKSPSTASRSPSPLHGEEKRITAWPRP